MLVQLNTEVSTFTVKLCMQGKNYGAAKMIWCLFLNKAWPQISILQPQVELLRICFVDTKYLTHGND